RTSSTRRFRARPSDVSFVSLGDAAPDPPDVRREAEIPKRLTRADTTAALHVVLSVAAHVVGVTLNAETPIRVAFHDHAYFLEHGLRLSPDAVAVEVEVDAVDVDAFVVHQSVFEGSTTHRQGTAAALPAARTRVGNLREPNARTGLFVAVFLVDQQGKPVVVQDDGRTF